MPLSQFAVARFLNSEEADSLSPTVKFVLSAIANYAGRRISCFPSQKKIAKYTSLTVRAVQNALIILQKESILVKQRIGKHLKYFFHTHFMDRWFKLDHIYKNEQEYIIVEHIIHMQKNTVIGERGSPIEAEQANDVRTNRLKLNKSLNHFGISQVSRSWEANSETQGEEDESFASYDYEKDYASAYAYNVEGKFRH